MLHATESFVQVVTRTLHPSMAMVIVVVCMSPVTNWLCQLGSAAMVALPALRSMLPPLSMAVLTSGPLVSSMVAT